MPTRTVDRGFRDFLSRLTPTPRESTAAIIHRASIEACLKSSFGMTYFFRTGSFGNGTSISGHSDVDYFAEIPARNLNKNSTYTLNRMRNALSKRFSKTDISVSRPAVIIRFGTNAKESTEITPAKYISLTKKGKYRIYRIPDSSSGWIFSSPHAHNAYVRKIDQKLDGQVKPLIRFIKVWKYCQKVPISSFYLELRVAKYAERNLGIVYNTRDVAVRRIFSHLHAVGLAKMQDPMGISGYISPCSTGPKLAEAKRKLSNALTRAQKACDASMSGNIKGAFYWWSLLYNGKFPGYYY